MLEKNGKSHMSHTHELGHRVASIDNFRIIKKGFKKMKPKNAMENIRSITNKKYKPLLNKLCSNYAI